MRLSQLRRIRRLFSRNKWTVVIAAIGLVMTFMASHKGLIGGSGSSASDYPGQVQAVQGNTASQLQLHHIDRPHTQTIPLAANATAQVAFSPDGAGQRNIVATIDEAQTRILVQAYGFTNKAILSALKKAKRRGVDVEVVLDKSNNQKRYTGATYMTNAGVPVWIDKKPAIAHNKVMIIDGHTVITGSFNFTQSAQTRNAENVLILRHVPKLAGLYRHNWLWRRSLSVIYKPH